MSTLLLLPAKLLLDKDRSPLEIQNFAARTGEGHKRYWDPVIIDYKAEAEERFTSLLLNGKSRELADVLRFMEDSENNINYLIALISPRVQIQRQTRDSESTQIRENVPWIRMLYVSAFARALAKNPKLLLCDEPTGALDYTTGKAVLKLLQDTCRSEEHTSELQSP